MKPLITFTNIRPDFLLEPPKPALNNIPTWYKSQESYIGGNKIPFSDGSTSATVKKCMPVFDSITAGYIIELPVDLYVSKENGIPHFSWRNLNYIDTQATKQVGFHPENTGFDIPKLMNVWAIKTTPGHSCLFLPPMHRQNMINILPAIVDTDSYNNTVRFPFTLSDPNFEGMIPSGTPVVQVIPFKREAWTSAVSEDVTAVNLVKSKLHSVFFNGYKNSFWHKKSYK